MLYLCTDCPSIFGCMSPQHITYDDRYTLRLWPALRAESWPTSARKAGHKTHPFASSSSVLFLNPHGVIALPVVGVNQDQSATKATPTIGIGFGLTMTSVRSGEVHHYSRAHLCIRYSNVGCIGAECLTLLPTRTKRFRESGEVQSDLWQSVTRDSWQSRVHNFSSSSKLSLNSLSPPKAQVLPVLQ